MILINWLKKYWYILYLFALLIIYGFPYFFEAKIPFPSSFVANNISPWNNYLFGGPVKNGIPDVSGEIYPLRSLAIDLWNKGIVPLWNPYVFSGTPLAANFQSAVFFPLNVIFWLIPKIDSWSILVLLQPILAAFFTFWFCRRLNLSQVGSLFSAIAFAFCGYLTVWGTYTTVGYTILFLPLVLFLLEDYFQRKRKYLLALIPLILSVSFLAGHIQTWSYVFLATVLYVLLRNTSGRLVWLSIFSVIPLVAFQLFPTSEFYFLSGRLLVRNLEQSGIPFYYLITLLAPDFFGNPVTRNDWLGTYAEWSGYTGLVTFILATIAVINIRRFMKITPFILFAVVGLLLAVQNPLLSKLFSLPLPILSNSNPSRAISLFSFAMAILSGFGFELVKDNFSKIKKSVVLIISGAILIIGSLYLMTFIGDFFFSEKIANNLRLISLRNLIFPSVILGSFLIIILGLWYKPKLKFLLTLGLLLLLSAEMIRFYKKWAPFDPRDFFYPRTKVTEYLIKQNYPYRFFGQFSQTPALINHLYSVEGYEPLNLLWYSQLIQAVSDGKLHNDYQLEVKLQSQETYTKRVLNLLGVKYLIYNAKNEYNPFVFPVWKYSTNLHPKIFDDQKYLIFENKETLERALLFSNFMVIPDKKQALETLFSPDFDTRTTLIVEDKPPIEKKELSDGTVKILKYEPTEIILSTKTEKSSLLFLSDSYYPGWKVYINDKLSKIIRANFSFRSVVVPSGDNLVIFRYEPESFRYGLIVSLVTLIVIVSFGTYSFVTRKTI